MSMLAEPRSRQKWSHDPRNTNWTNDKTKFGYQMLSKMGWSEGQGLGLKLSGGTGHIRVNKKRGNAGVGLKKSHDDDWITHQDDFNALLSSLNNGNAESSETVSDFTKKVKSSKVRYGKFVKSKDLSNASSQDLACIFGQRNNSVTAAPEENDQAKLKSSETSCLQNEDNCIHEELSVKVVQSSLSMEEYFAKKMEELNERKTARNSAVNSNSNADHDTCVSGGTKKKKNKKRKMEDAEVFQCSEIEEKSASKKKKKKEVVFENGLVEKKMEEEEKVDTELVPSGMDKVGTKTKKPKKKRKIDDSN